MTDTLEVRLVRHGETDNNREGLDGTFGDDRRLNEVGERQARQLGRQLASEHCGAELIIASPKQRTRTTAEMLGGILQTPVRIDERLVEFDAGDWADRPIKNVVAEFLRLPVTARPDFRPPHGESWLDIAARMRAVIDDAEAEGLRNIVLVGHSSPIQFCVGSLLGREPYTWLDTPEPRNATAWKLTKVNGIWQDQLAIEH